MDSNIPNSTTVGRCIADLLREIDRAQKAAITFDIAAFEDTVRQHSRLGQELKEALTHDPGAQSLIHSLRPALKRYSLLLRGSERLTAIISRVVECGTVNPALEG